MTPEAVAKLCLQKYRELPKTGKPDEDQWSILSGIVLYDANKKKGNVISLGLGTKCIGAGKMCKNGLIVNDSHAEVLARRGLLRYLFYELNKCSLNKNDSVDSIVQWNAKQLKYDIKQEYSFHFFCTQPPCGDACIIDEVELSCEPPAKRKKDADDLGDEIGDILPLPTTTIYTGAKVIEQIRKHDDCMIQTCGALRIKPGKGDRTLSMSCSDKISKWCILGLQGALLDTLLSKPIYLSSLSFCTNANLNALKRAFCERWKSKSNINSFELNRYKKMQPLLQICNESIRFECAATEKRKKPAPTGIVWCNLPEYLKPCEIIVNGKRQGCTKKSIGTPQGALKISKYHLFQDFLTILGANQSLKQRIFPINLDFKDLNYLEAKDANSTYQKAWKIIKAEYFGNWTEKPSDLKKFVLNRVCS